jgi:hypothetical protein
MLSITPVARLPNFLPLRLILGSLWAIDVVGIQELVLLLPLFRLVLPHPPLLRRKGLPLLADGF